MRRFSDLVSVARVDAAVDRFLAFFLGSRKRKNRDSRNRDREKERVEPDTVSHT